MDIDYLLLLQNFREATNNVLTPFLWQLSEFIIGIGPIFIVAMFYWVFSKRTGGWIMLNLAGVYWLNGMIKLTACVYRPWVRDTRIIPAGDAITTATGYSFPSGHTMFATAYYGSGAVCCWKNKKTRVVSVLCIILLALTMFARNYLGVHTPQDVLVGCVASLVLMAAIVPLFRRMQAGNAKQDNIILLAGLLLVAVSALYITLKPYPMDYVNGVLLVDPEKMKPDSIGGIGALLGVVVGWYLEKRYVHFENPVDKRKGFLVSLLCFVPVVLWLLIFSKFAPHIIGEAAAKGLRLSVAYVYILAGAPLVLKKFAPAAPSEKA